MDFYLLGYWNNAYSRLSDKEYFWGGPYDSRKEAIETGKRRQNQGQPKRFIDWSSGVNRAFSTKETFLIQARKVGLNPSFDDE